MNHPAVPVPALLPLPAGGAGSYQISACVRETTFDLNATLFWSSEETGTLGFRSVNLPIRRGMVGCTSRDTGSKLSERADELSRWGTRRMCCEPEAALPEDTVALVEATGAGAGAEATVLDAGAATCATLPDDVVATFGAGAASGSAGS